MTHESVPASSFAPSRAAPAVESPITILVGALGGEGGGVLAQWLVDTATRAGYVAQSTSIPGVAQRTGATTYYVEVFPRARAELGGRLPVLSLLPVPGRIDVAIASELLEAARIVANGMVSADRTTLVASTSRTLTTAEKMVPGDGRFDAERLLTVAREHSRHLVAFDMAAAARDAGTLVSAVMLGAVAATDALPIARHYFEATVRDAGRGADASLAGFASGWAAVRAALPNAGTGVPAAVAAAGDAGTAGAARTLEPAGDAERFAAFAPAARDVLALGVARLVDFQDAAYADLYLARLARVQAAEQRGDPQHAHGGALLRETARFLVLWMAFDDVIRVADLKSRASRFARVRADAAAGAADLVRIIDHFKPGIPECVDLLPPWLARRAVAWDRARQQRGAPAWSLPLKLRADSITGFLALRLLAGRRRARPRGARYAREQAAIGTWLAAVERWAAADWACGHEVALCGRLVKGYGATNERGQRNLAHILAHLAEGGTFASTADRAAAIRRAREAALADEGGQALDRTLVAHGAPARPVVAQPVRWVRRTPAPAAPRSPLPEGESS